MSSINKVVLVGRVGRDPEVKTFQSGGRVASLTLATSESWKDKATGEKKERTEWHKVSIFNESLVGVVERFVKKGSKLYIEGQLETRKWTDDAGKDNYSTEVVLRPYRGEIVLLDNKEKQEHSEPQYEPQTKPSDYSHDIDSEVPF